MFAGNICKLCSFECNLGKYSSRPIIKVIGRVLYFPISNIAQKMKNICIFSHHQVTHGITAIQCSESTLNRHRVFAGNCITQLCMFGVLFRIVGTMRIHLWPNSPVIIPAQGHFLRAQNNEMVLCVILHDSNVFLSRTTK